MPGDCRLIGGAAGEVQTETLLEKPKDRGITSRTTSIMREQWPGKMAEYNSCCSNQSFSGLPNIPKTINQLCLFQITQTLPNISHAANKQTNPMPNIIPPPNKQTNRMPNISHATNKQTNPMPNISHPPNKQTNPMPDRSNATNKQTNPMPNIIFQMIIVIITWLVVKVFKIIFPFP